MATVSCIQMASGPKVGANLLEAERLIANAVKKGANLVVLPENFAIMGKHERDKIAVREVAGKGTIQDFLSRQARRHAVWIVGGTVPLQAGGENKVRAASLVFDDTGKQVARYDKIHLFDVALVDSGEKYTESETIEAGDQVVVIDSPFGRLGLSVCYDLRFPELFRAMVDQGMELLVIPSAFTAITGKAHWEILLRARAIENLCYVLASAQGGFHFNGRETYGNSMIVDPWGQVLDRLPTGAGVVTAKLDMKRLRNLRRTFPCLNHRRKE